MMDNYPQKEEVQILKSALRQFRRRSQIEARLLLTTAVILTVAAIVVVAVTAVNKNITVSVLGSGGIFGLLTFARSVYERNIACEFDCEMLQVQLAIGGFQEFQKAVVKVSCNKLTNLKLPMSTKGEKENG